MYKTSQRFKELSTSQARRPIPKVIINGVDVDFISLDFEEPREGFIGGFSSKSIKISLGQEAYLGSYQNAIIEPFMSFYGSTEQVPIGVFFVDIEDVSFDEISRVYTIVAYDSANKFDKKYEEIELPKTGKELINEIASRVGMQVSDSIDTLSFSNQVIEKINLDEKENISYRQVLNHFSQLNLCSVHISRDDKLEFRTVFNIEVREEITDFDYFNLTIDKDIKPINALVYEQENIEDAVYSKNMESIEEYGLTEIKLQENIFLEPLSREMKENYIDEMFQHVNGYLYHPFETDQVMRPEFDTLDSIYIVDRNKQVFPTVITSVSWSWINGGFRGKVTCPRLPETITNYELSGEKQSYKNMGIRVNRVEGSIESVINIVDVMDGKIQEQGSNIVQTQKEIQQEIIDRTQMGEDILKETSSNLTQTTESLELSFNRIEEQQENSEKELSNLRTYFRWDENGAIIGKDGDLVEFFQTNEMIGFRSKGTVLAEWKQGTMSVDHLIANISIIIGSHLVENYESPILRSTSLIRKVGE